MKTGANVVPFKPQVIPLSLDQIISVGVDRLPEVFTPKPFTDEQAKDAREAAGLTAHAGDLPENFSQAANVFFTHRINATTNRKQRNEWSEARKTARHLLKALKPLSHDEELYANLEEFCDKANRVIEFMDRLSKRRPQRRQRPDAMATIILTHVLVIEFQRLFEQDPTASSQGAFEKFSDCWTTGARDQG